MPSPLHLGQTWGTPSRLPKVGKSTGDSWEAVGDCQGLRWFYRKYNYVTITMTVSVAITITMTLSVTITITIT